MRFLVAAAALALLAGCASLQQGPALLVRDDTGADITGEASLLTNATGALEAKWGFTVPAQSYREVARLPTEPAGMHRLVVRVDRGATAQTLVSNDPGSGAIVVHVTDRGLVFEPQSA